MGEITDVICEIKEDKEKFYLLVDKFAPMIKKYIRLLYKDEAEDTYAEMVLALWEATNNITYYENDGQVVKYLNMAVKNKFLGLYRNSRKYHDNECGDNDVEDFTTPSYTENEYEEMVVNEDVKCIIANLSEKKREISYLILRENLSDAEVGNRLGLSRQYVHRVRKGLSELFLEEYFN